MNVAVVIVAVESASSSFPAVIAIDVKVLLLCYIAVESVSSSFSAVVAMWFSLQPVVHTAVFVVFVVHCFFIMFLRRVLPTGSFST